MMETHSILSRIPNFSKAFIFGSILTSSKPQDLDLLVIYDVDHCQPKEAYFYHKSLYDGLRYYFGLPIHIILLTLHEEKCVRMVERTHAIPLKEFINKLQKIT